MTSFQVLEDFESKQELSWFCMINQPQKFQTSSFLKLSEYSWSSQSKIHLDFESNREPVCPNQSAGKHQKDYLWLHRWRFFHPDNLWLGFKSQNGNEKPWKGFVEHSPGETLWGAALCSCSAPSTWRKPPGWWPAPNSECCCCGLMETKKCNEHHTQKSVLITWECGWAHEWTVSVRVRDVQSAEPKTGCFCGPSISATLLTSH